MIRSYVVYDPHTGRITKAVTCPPSAIELQCGKDEKYLEGVIASDAYYVLNQRITPRPTAPIEVKEHTLYGVPKGALINIEDETYLADGGPVELSFELPGSYLIRISHWPYLDWETTLEN